VAVAVVVGAVVVGRSGDVSARSVALDDGSAWLVSSSVGQATLVDGASAQVVARVEVSAAAGPARLAAVQSGADAYVSNTADGTVRRLDGATLEVSGGVRLGHPGQPLAVYAGRRAVFAASELSGTVTAADPRTLQPLPARDETSLAARVPPGGAVVDGAGRLWVIDGDTGRVIRLDAHGRRDLPGGVDPDRATLVLAGERVAVVDPVQRTVRLLGGRGLSDPVACVDTRADDDTARVAGSVSADRVHVVSGRRGVLLVADLSDASCDNTLINLDAAGHDLGAPREAAGRVFVPDFTAGRVLVVDVAARRVEARPVVLPERTEFELVPQGSFVFYNDPASERAGVVHLDGSVRQIRKYNPDDPGEGVYRGAGPFDGPGASPPPSAPPRPAPPPPDRPTRAPDSPTGEVRIALSDLRVSVGRPVAMRVLTAGGAVVAGARWTFGDGGEATGVRVRHSWSQPGLYRVQAQTVLADNRQATPAAQVTVTAEPDPTPTATPPPDVTPSATPPDRPPVARLAVSPPRGGTPLTVGANASASIPGSSPITRFSFDFDDGPPTGGTRPTATHTYTAARTYTVTLTVTDSAGQTDADTATVTATTTTPPPPPPPPPPGPTARLTVTPASGTAPLRVRADASGSRPGGNPIAGYSFNLTGTYLRPQPGSAIDFTFSNPGDYDVAVIVTDTAGRTDKSEPKRVSVTPPSLRQQTAIDFEAPALGSYGREIVNPYVAEGVTFTTTSSSFPDAVVGLVKNSVTSACVEPADADQKLGTGREGYGVDGSIGLAAFPITARFSAPLRPAAGKASVQVTFQSTADAVFRLRLFDSAGKTVGEASAPAGPPAGTCGYPGNPRGWAALTADSASEVASAAMEEVSGGRVFVIDDFTFRSAQS
jgi:PKD repeat protein